MGLEPTSPGGAAPVGQVREGAGESVCLPGQCTLPPVVLHVGAPRASGLGCSGPRLARAGAYAFPPFPLIQAVLDMTRMAEHRLLLVAPYWTRQPWFSLLLALLPWQLPLRPDLLSQVGGTLWHPRLHRLSLWAGLTTEQHRWSMLGLQEGVMNTMQSARALVIPAAYL